jgi:hypothetical protein
MTWQPMLTALSLAPSLHPLMTSSGVRAGVLRDSSEMALICESAGTSRLAVARPEMRIGQRRSVPDRVSQPAHLTGPHRARFVPATRLR